MKTSFAKSWLLFVACCVFFAGGCKSRNEQGCGSKCTPEQYEQARDKGYSLKNFDADFLKEFYGDAKREVDLSRFTARSFLSKRCARISPVENAKTTVPLPAADNTICPAATPTPRNPVRAGTSVPGIQYIGRVDLKVTLPDQTQKDFLWATAFKVGEKTRDGKRYDLIATTCHALQPVITKESGEWKLNPPSGETLWFDLGERTDYSASQYSITQLVAYGQQPGLDVAFLEVEHSSEGKLQFLPREKAAAASRLAPPAALTVVGYVDFLHPVDPLFDLSYGPFVSFGDDKFVSLGRYSRTKFAAANGLDAREFSERSYLLHDAATSMGQSGSPVFAGEDLKETLVLGVHVCCTAYWEDDKTYPPIDEKMIPCGKVTRSGYNKAVSALDILDDKQLCNALNDYGNSYKCLP